NILKAAGALPIGTIALAQATHAASDISNLPDKASFEKMDVTYLNCASQHPLPTKSLSAAEQYYAKRSFRPNTPRTPNDSYDALHNYAKLINADIDEVAYAQSTTAAEQMILRSLGFPEAGGHIISDEFHFGGSKITYDSLKKLGMDLTRLKEKDGKIELEDIKKALRPDTKIIAVSLISTITGFEHDLKAICEIAHANGTLVYADVIQAAGAMPIDVKESGVDFIAGSSFKWLMGDYGTGFLYASKEAQNHLKRANYGFYGFRIPAGSPSGELERDEYGYPKSAFGHFAIGSYSFAGVELANESLKYILALGVENIHAHNQKLNNLLKEELPKIGFALRTPLDSKGPLVVAGKPGVGAIISPYLKEAKITMSVYKDRFRVSASIFNDVDDIEYLLQTLKKAYA
ncbi:MAG: aminotransferase class V-fold PLP-dependent enzyme, partial [Kordiimonadaceae bacterium]|nr:aminotransferase class V-fold PLP-dependent enzyme [Kordiimonadaceae bacterium]